MSSKSDSRSRIDLGSLAALLVLSPLVLFVGIMFGVFAVGRMMTVLLNPAFLGIIILFEALLYRTGSLTPRNILTSGLITGFVFWLIGLVALLQPISPICSIPFIGPLVCGTIGIISIFTDLFGYIIAGIVVASVTGFVLATFRR